MFDLAVVILRVQPLHRGHIYNIDTGLELANKVLVLIGSAFNSENKFTYLESENLVSTRYLLDNKIYIEPLADFLYEENQWLTEVQDIVKTYTPSGSTKVVLIGHEIDQTSYYLKSFPQWGFFDTGEWQEDIYTSKANTKNIVKNNFSVRSIVLQSGHILLVENGDLLALPGGALGETETLQETAIRELREEIKLKVPVPVLNGSIRKEKTFSRKGKAVTQGYYFQLKDNEDLPKVKEAIWVPLADFYEMESQMVEDHFHIVKKMIDNE